MSLDDLWLGTDELRAQLVNPDPSEDPEEVALLRRLVGLVDQMRELAAEGAERASIDGDIAFPEGRDIVMALHREEFDRLQKLIDEALREVAPSLKSEQQQ